MDGLAATEYLAHSTIFTSVGLIGYVIIGGLAGAFASKIIRGSGAGILMDIVIGIIGSLVGGFTLSFFVNPTGGGVIFTFLTALLGSLILLWVVGLVRRT